MLSPELNYNIDYVDFKCSIFFSTLKYIGLIEKNIIDINLFRTQKFAPTAQYSDLIIRQLAEKQYISIKTDYNNFKIAEPFNDSILVVNDDIVINEIKNNNLSRENIMLLWKEIGVWECIEFLNFHLEELKLPCAVSGSLLELYNELLNDFSIAQVFNITYSSIESALYQLRKGHFNEFKAFYYILEMIKSKGNRSIREGYKLYNYNRPSKCSQSELSNYFFNKVLQISDNGFKVVPSWE